MTSWGRCISWKFANKSQIACLKDQADKRECQIHSKNILKSFQNICKSSPKHPQIMSNIIQKSCMYLVYTLYIPCIYPAYTLYIPCIYLVNTFYILYTLFVCTLYISRKFPVSEQMARPNERNERIKICCSNLCWNVILHKTIKHQPYEAHNVGKF